MVDEEQLPVAHVRLIHHGAFCSVEAPVGTVLTPPVAAAVLYVNELIRGGFAFIDCDGWSFKIDRHPDATVRQRLAYILSICSGNLVAVQDPKDQ